MLPGKTPANINSIEDGRLASLDAFRGFVILTMVFVNYIAGMKAIPFILRHASAEMDAYTITDAVFPGFLFIVGMAIPLAIGKRLQEGFSAGRILSRIVIRTAGLIFLGIIMVNENRYSAADTGLSKELWYLLAYLAVIALWTAYPKTERQKYFNLNLAIRLAAVVVLTVLVVIYRGRTDAGALIWLQTSWWGILGQIGWAYLVCSVLYLIFGRSRIALMGWLGLLVALNIFNHLGALNLPGTEKAAGTGMQAAVTCHSTIVMAGVVVGTLFSAAYSKTSHRQRSMFMFLFGSGLYAAGLLLRPIQGISKIRATESFALVTAGACCLTFLIFYVFMDVLKLRRWGKFLQPVGRNPLLAYLLPGIMGSLFWIVSAVSKVDVNRLIWPLYGYGGLAGMANALVVTGFVLLLTALATRLKVILKI